MSLNCLKLNEKWILINNSRYYLSLVRIFSNEGGWGTQSPLILAPLQRYDLDVIRTDGKYYFEYINDLGETKAGDFICH